MHLSLKKGKKCKPKGKEDISKREMKINSEVVRYVKVGGKRSINTTQ